MDLKFPHHECEIAQSIGAYGLAPVRYWMHANMLTVNGDKMSKSKGNSFLPGELFSGQHPLLDKAYAPMAVRFFMMQSHYASTLDFSNEALQAAEKGFRKLMSSVALLNSLPTAAASSSDITALRDRCYAAMNDDFNTPILVAHLFEAVRIINSVNAGTETITKADLVLLSTTVNDFVFGILGLKQEEEANNDLLGNLLNMILNTRTAAKQNKDFAASDKIRDELASMGIRIKDGKDGTTWSIEN